MAEAILAKELGGVAEVASAGSEPAGHVHPLALSAIKEIGLSLPEARSKNLSEFLDRDVHTVITVCGNADAKCPTFPGQPLPKEKITEMILYVRESEIDSYRAVLFSLAEARRIRPAFIQKKHRNDQAKWMIEGLVQKKQAQFAEHFLQIWLMKGHQEMLVSFLDAMEISHDGSGGLESFPQELESSKLKPAIEKLLGDFEQEAVAIYLHTFQLQKPGGYEALSECLESDQRLKLSKEAAPSTPAGDNEKSQKEPPVKEKEGKKEEPVT